MSFLTWGALAVGLLVIAPVLAHLLRRKKAQEHLFAATRLVPAMAPQARQKSFLEDRSLFAARALAVILLAALGATPFMSCSRLSVTRRAGASVALAIVIDDSLSMRAPIGDGPAGKGKGSRFERAKTAATELIAGAYQGDAIAIVLAGSPARVALAATTDLVAARAAIAAVEPSDRATDLDGAVALGRELVKGLVQPDRRVVLLSDLADGQPDAAPIGASEGVAVWAPLTELRAAGADCAVTRADRSGGRIRAHVVCTEGAAAERRVEVRGDGGVVGSAALDPKRARQDVIIDVKAELAASLRATLTGADAIAEDDSAPVVAQGAALVVATVVDAAANRVATGGPPPIEQAFAALDSSLAVRPLTGVPEHAEDLESASVLIVDDPPGFTPEARRALAAWVRQGGIVLVTLGPRAAAAPLGAGFDPLIPGVVRWVPGGALEGITPGSAPSFGAAAAGLEHLDPRGRTVLDPSAKDGADVLAQWKDGAPFLTRRSLGRGAALTLTLPLSTDESDVALRPAFLALLDQLVSLARTRGVGAQRVDAGQTWVFDGYHDVTVSLRPIEGDPRRLELVHEDGRLRATPAVAGLYDVTLDGAATTRVVAVPDREIDLRPREVAPSAEAASMGGMSESIDVSPYLALGLLGLVAVELFLRTLNQRRETAAGDAAPTGVGAGPP